jgi:hypothetical protein
MNVRLFKVEYNKPPKKHRLNEEDGLPFVHITEIEDEKNSYEKQNTGEINHQLLSGVPLVINPSDTYSFLNSLNETLPNAHIKSVRVERKILDTENSYKNIILDTIFSELTEWRPRLIFIEFDEDGFAHISDNKITNNIGIKELELEDLPSIWKFCLSTNLEEFDLIDLFEFNYDRKMIDISHLKIS